MTQKVTKAAAANQWQEKMYDEWFIRDQLNSPYFLDFAKKEAEFLIRNLKLKPGMALLDVPCGAGRHSSEFAKAGIQVTAVDLNDQCLAFARKNCKGKRVDVRKGNLIDLKKFRNEFDATTNLFSSFGYFATDEENEAVMKELVSTLKPGGKLALHLVNRDWLLKVFKPVDWRIQGDLLELEARRYDPKTRYNESFLVVLNQKTGKGRSYYHRIRLYSKKEIVSMMKRCGLKNVKAFPACSAESFSRQKNSHPLYVGTKR
jgi:SAM-dependent methyltransferase